VNDSKWERTAALGGFVFVILNAVGGFLPGTPPAADDSKEKVFTFFADHESALKWNQVLAGIGAIGLAWWFGSLFRRLRAAEDGNPRLSVAALLGLALGGSMALVSGAIVAATAQRLDNLGPDFTRALFTVASVMLAGSAFGVVIFLGAVCALNLRAKMFPAWTNYVGWLAAAGFLAGSFAAVTDAAAIGALGFLSFLVWCVWILALSTMMWRGSSTTS
jgi:hypothetical protein